MVAYRSLKKSSLVKLLFPGHSIWQKLHVYICSAVVIVTKLQDGQSKNGVQFPAEVDLSFF